MAIVGIEGDGVLSTSVSDHGERRARPRPLATFERGLGDAGIVG